MKETKIENRTLIKLLDAHKVLNGNVDMAIAEQYGHNYRIVYRNLDYYVTKEKEKKEIKKPFKISLNFTMCHNTMIFCSIFVVCLMFFIVMISALSPGNSLISFNSYENCSVQDRYPIPYWDYYTMYVDKTITQYKDITKCYTVSDCVQNMSLDGCYYDGCNWCCGNTCTVRQCVEIVET